MSRSYLSGLESSAPGEAARIRAAREMAGERDDVTGEIVELAPHEELAELYSDESWWLSVDSSLVGDRAETGYIRPEGIAAWLGRHGVTSSPPWPHFEIATDLLGMIRLGAIQGDHKARERARELRGSGG